MMDWAKEFQVTNNSGRILISGVVTLENETVTVIEPSRYPEKLVADLQVFERRKFIEVTNTITVKPTAKKDAFAIKSLDSSNGKKAISVEAIDTGKGAIVVENTTEPPKAKAVEETKAPVIDEKITKEQAVELLGSHWKKFEAAVNLMTDARKLNFLQVVAQEIGGIADKKLEIIEARLQEI